MVGGIEKNSCLLLGIDLYCFFEGDLLVYCSSLFNCQTVERKCYGRCLLIVGTRKYVLRFDNSYLIRSIIKLLGDKGFLPVRVDI